jgi:hypothetical protein
MAKWIQKAIKKKGALHRALGVPAKEKIPLDLLKEATHSKNKTLKKRATLALTLRKFHPK